MVLATFKLERISYILSSVSRPDDASRSSRMYIGAAAHRRLQRPARAFASTFWSRSPSTLVLPPVDDLR